MRERPGPTTRAFHVADPVAAGSVPALHVSRTTAAGTVSQAGSSSWPTHVAALRRGVAAADGVGAMDKTNDAPAGVADATLLDELAAMTPERRLRWNGRVATTVLELRHGLAAAAPDHAPRPAGQF